MDSKKFKSLKAQRQATLVLEDIRTLEAYWDKESVEKKSLMEELCQKLTALSPDIPTPHPGFWQHAARRLEDMDLRSFLDLALPLERYCQKKITDAEILPVIEGDRVLAKAETYPLVLVLDHLRSAFNVGAIFRSAECLGVEHIYLVGYTPTPEDSQVQKTSMGTHKWLPWTAMATSGQAYTFLKKKDYYLVGLETLKKPKPITSTQLPKPLALVLGHERFGLLPETLSEMDDLLCLPMRGRKNSMNVASAASIATHWIIHQWQEQG